MSLSVLLPLLLLVCSVQADFYGIVVNYYPNSNGNSTGILHYKLSDSSCIFSEPFSIGGESIVLNKVDEESNGGPCQTEGTLTQLFTSYTVFELPIGGLNWISGIKNGIVSFKAYIVVDLTFRSDIGQANTSPQTTIIPAVRVPSNCARNFDLLTFDPDGDVVKCRNGMETLSECSPCTPPPVLSLSSSNCTLSFSPTNSSNEGLYAVQLMMEDFPTGNIELFQSNGQPLIITPNDAIGRIPVQFVFIVDPAVPSCTEGLFLPMFLPPTPANKDQLYTDVNQALQINISAQALTSTISELLFSGPYTVTKNQTGPGQFTLTWTPSDIVAGQSHPICFVVEAIFGANKYQSELRCLIVSVGNALNPTSATIVTDTPTTTTPPTSAITVTDTLTTTTPPTPTTTVTDTLTTTTPPTPTSTAPPTTPPPTPTTTPPPTSAITVTDTLTTTAPPTPTTTPPPTSTTTLPDTLTTTTPPTPTTTAPPTPTTTLPPTAIPVPPINTPEYIADLKIKLTSLVNLDQIDAVALLNQMKLLLESYGLPDDITLRVRSTNPPLDVTVGPGYVFR